MKNKRLIEFLATGFYIGKIPYAPGTFGTLLALPFAFLLAQAGPMAYAAAAVLMILFSSFVAELYESFHTGHDPSEVVIDEVSGTLVALLWLPLTWQTLVFGFVLFRFFDILKPFPISYIDRKVEGGLGTVLDDVAAGLFTNVILQVVFTQTSWLGVRLSGA